MPYKPSFELTVGSFFVRVPSLNGEEGAMEDLELPVVKSITVQPNENSNSIYGSGAVYDVVSVVNDAKIGLNVIALPRRFLDYALGALRAGAASVDSSQPVKPEFACGYTAENSDGSRVYYYHPRCKLMQTNNRQHQTSTNTPADPSVEYEISLLPTDEKIWRMRYYTADAGENALSAQEFFAKHPGTIAEIEALSAPAQSAGKDLPQDEPEE